MSWAKDQAALSYVYPICLPQVMRLYFMNLICNINNILTPFFNNHLINNNNNNNNNNNYNLLNKNECSLNFLKLR